MSARTKRYAMTVDTRLCVGCKACVLACKAENAVPDGFCRDWVVEEVRGEFPEALRRDPLGEVQPLRGGPVRQELPDRGEFRRARAASCW